MPKIYCRPEIRRATLEDLPAIHHCANAAYAGYIHRIDHAPEPLTADYSDLIAQQDTFICELQQMCVGVIVLCRRQDRFIVFNVAVQPEHQGKGIGTTLLTLAEDYARAEGVTLLSLYTNEVMIESQNYYLNRGWKITKRAQQDGYARVFMEKQIGEAQRNG